MRVLVISEEIGGSASGNVFERIISELSVLCDVDLVTCSYKPCTQLKLSRIQLIKWPNIHYKVKKYLFSIFKTDILTLFLKYRIRIVSSYDAVFSLSSSECFFGLIAGDYIRNKINVKWCNYFTDAIPAPLGWSHDDQYYKSVLYSVRKHLSKTDVLFSVNEKMLDYQLSLFERKDTLKAEVVYPPMKHTGLKTLPKPPKGVFRFLYTGNIYGKRTSRNVIKAFSLLVKERPNVELIFVGSMNAEAAMEKTKYSSEVKDKIKIEPSTNDLNPFYEHASVFLDIDAVVNNDVFLSSKMSEYIAYNRPIICETGENSPSRSVFGGIPSILQCNHNTYELKNAMLYSMDHFDEFDYRDRNDLFDKFSAIQSAQLIYNTLKCVLHGKE